MFQKLLSFVALSFVCLSGFCQEKFTEEIKVISDNLYTQMTAISKNLKLENNKIKIAITGIDNEKNVSTTLTELIENKLAINLATKSAGQYAVLDRNYIEKLMSEKKLPLKYDNKGDYAKNLGKIRAANMMIVGTLTNFENEFELNLQIIETEEGGIVGGASGSITATTLLRSKNNETSGASSMQQIPPVSQKTEPRTESKYGIIKVVNKINSNLIAMLGVETVEPSNFAKKYDELSLAANATDSYENIAPGVYYICIVGSRGQINGCGFSKRVVVEAGKTTTVNISTYNSW